MFSEEKEELERRFGGIAALKSIPDALFMVDIKTERTALAESRGRGIPVIAITDTNTNPALVEYPIPANDDGIQAIELMTKTIVDAYQEGRNQNIEQQEQQQNTGQQLATESTMKEENSKFEAPNSK